MIKKETIIYFLLLIIFLLSGNIVFQLFFLALFGVVILILSRKKLIIDERAFFYLGLSVMSFIQFFLVFRSDYSFNYVLNSGIALLFWLLAFLAFLVIKSITVNFSIEYTKKFLNSFFIINVLMLVYQFIIVVLETKTLNPFSSTMFSYGQSTGDHLKGVFSNSSISMIIMSFYTVFYAYKKDWKVILAIISMLCATYMSGVFIFAIIATLYVFFMLGIKTKLKIVGAMAAMVFILAIVTPNNLSYVKFILTDNLNSKVDPPRKMISFEETIENAISSPQSFFFGEGAGKFSSRTAFLTAGDYTAWFPKKMRYKSQAFEDNHFQLWNNKILAISYKDGTHNQPFSFYNQILGEFGFFGIILFIIYLFYTIRNWNRMTYGRILILTTLGFFVLDYWFDYFTVIMFLELFINLNIKENNAIQESN